MKTLLSEPDIEKIVNQLAENINRDYQGRNLLVVGILKGSVIFLSDLVRKLKIPVVLDFIQVSSYVGTNSTGAINIKKDLGVDISGRDILIVEDIIDTGNTLNALKAELQKRNPKSIKVAALLDKPSRRKVAFKADYTGIEIPDEFVVGYGLDYNEEYRNLPYIGIYQP